MFLEMLGICAGKALLDDSKREGKRSRELKSTNLERSSELETSSGIKKAAGTGILLSSEALFISDLFGLTE
jgi:hypothetical protein